jgi:hypothetical protein
MKFIENDYGEPDEGEFLNFTIKEYPYSFEERRRKDVRTKLEESRFTFVYS